MKRLIPQNFVDSLIRFHHHHLHYHYHPDFFVFKWIAPNITITTATEHGLVGGVVSVSCLCGRLHNHIPLHFDLGDQSPLQSTSDLADDEPGDYFPYDLL